MQILKELPAGTIWPHLLDAIERQVLAEIDEYAKSRKNNVARGAETPELAALLVDQYGSGVAKALHIAGIDSEVQEFTDRLERDVDSGFDEHRKQRWAARPAGLALRADSETPMKSYTIDLADDEVLVALKRGEDYDDVHPELVAEDAIGDRWPEYRTIHGEGLRSREVRAWAHEEDPTRVISAAQKAQAERDGGASASSVRPFSEALS